MRAYRHAWGAFSKTFGRRPISTITPQEIDRWIEAKGGEPLTIRNRRRDILVLFNYARVEGYYSFDLDSKVGGLRKREVRETEEEVSILTPAQSQAVLEASSPDVLPFIALGLFAGLRVAELRRLTWDDVDFASKKIYLRKAKSKTKSRRGVTMQDALLSWLQGFEGAQGVIISISERAMTPIYGELAKAAGLPKWPKNVLRKPPVRAVVFSI